MSRDHLTAQLDAITRKPVAMRGEPDRKPLAEDLARAVGAAIEQAIKLARLEKKDVAFQMGYADQSALARWIAGVETPQFAKLFAIRSLRGPLVIALAALSEDAEIVTTITLRRSA